MLVSKFLIERLENAGVRHVFGVPGAYVLDFYKELWASQKIKVINSSDENHAGFAADAYARVNGIGCTVVTYSVGASKVINAVQCAYAERSPLIVISGAPGIDERNESVLLHNMLRSFNSQKKMFDEITCASIFLDNPVTAGFEIDQAFEKLKHFKRPIYIELPRDIARQSLSYDVYKQGTPKSQRTDSENLLEAVEEASQWINQVKRPVILAGVEIARYGLGDQLIRFAEKHNIPIVTTLLSKSVVNECHRLFAGVYLGSGTNDGTKQCVDESDCLLVFGDVFADMALYFKPSKFEKRQIIYATVESLQIKNHNYPNIQFVDFCKSLFKLNLTPHQEIDLPKFGEKVNFSPKIDTKITNERLFAKINSILDKNMAIVADIGDSLFAASNLTVHNQNQFLSPAFYASMGFAIPGALGVQAALPDVRPIVIVGDGAFQMSCIELNTIYALGLNPIIFVLNNGGYASERLLVDGEFNNFRKWNYHKITDAIGGKGYLVNTEEDLEIAVKDSLESNQFSVINVVLDKKDVSSTLKKVIDSLKKGVN